MSDTQVVFEYLFDFWHNCKFLQELEALTCFDYGKIKRRIIIELLKLEVLDK